MTTRGGKFEIWLSSLDAEPASTELSVLLGLLKASPLWTGVVKLRKDSEEKLRDLSSAEKLVANPGFGLTLDFTTPDDPKGETHELRLAWDGFGIVLSGTYLNDHFDSHRGTLIADVIALAGAVSEATRDSVCIGPIGRLAMPLLEIPHRRPPRMHKHFGRSAVVDFLSARFQREDRLGHPEDYAVLATSELPPGVERTTTGDLTVIRWVESLATDDADLLGAMLERDRWMREHLELPILKGYNAEGDQQFRPSRLKRHELLSFYSDSTSTAFKPIFFDGSREEFDQVTETLRAWLADGKAPDGTELKEAVVVVPLRELALAAIQFGADSGIKGAYYPSDDGSMWWNPAPAGNWLD